MRRVDGGYRVTAMKPFASGSPKGDVLVTSAAYDDPVDGPIVMHFPVYDANKQISRISRPWECGQQARRP